MRDGLASYDIFLVVQGENNLSRLVEVLGWVVYREETIPDKEHKLQEELELDCPAVVYALGLFTVPDTEVESQLDQVGGVVGLGVGVVGSCGHNGVNDSLEDFFSCLTGGSSIP